MVECNRTSRAAIKNVHTVWAQSKKVKDWHKHTNEAGDSMLFFLQEFSMVKDICTKIG